MDPVQKFIYCSFNTHLNVNLTIKKTQANCLRCYLSSGYRLQYGVNFGSIYLVCLVLLLIIPVIVVRNVNYEVSLRVFLSSLLITFSIFNSN